LAKLFADHHSRTNHERDVNVSRWIGDVLQHCSWWFLPNEPAIVAHWGEKMVKHNVTDHQREGAALAFGSPTDPPPSKRMKKEEEE
jgi:hypothetical protein